MAEAEEFGSLDDSMLLLACAEYEQSQQDGTTVGGKQSDTTASSKPIESTEGVAASNTTASKLTESTEGVRASNTTASSKPAEPTEGVGASNTTAASKPTECTEGARASNTTASSKPTESTGGVGASNSTASLGQIDIESNNKSTAEHIYEMNNEIITDFVRSIRSKYINTSDLQMQEWCEQQMIYNISSKYGMAPVQVTEEGAAVPMKDIQLTTPAMKAGTKIHQEKDLEVNSYVRVNVTRPGDIWGLKMLNTIQNIRHLVMGARCIREVVAFSMPYDYGYLVMGIVDELRMNEHDELELVEVKTRSNQRPPSKAQKRTHNLQAMMYKQIIDDLVSGVVDGKVVLKKLRLDPEHVLHDDVMVYARQLDITGNTVGDLLTSMLDQFRFLPKVSSMVLEYYPSTSGDRKNMIRSDRVVFDEVWLRKRLESHFGFWRGEKEVSGIEDVGEIWKCNMCQFVDVCHWRKQKNEECLKKINKGK